MNSLIDDNNLDFASVDIINCDGGINHSEVLNGTLSGIIARKVYKVVMTFHNEGMPTNNRCVGMGVHLQGVFMQGPQSG